MEHFLSLLSKCGIETLVDVRSKPYSRFCSHFRKKPFREKLEGLGIRYLFMGDRLGGLPTDESFYDDEGYVLYSRMAESPEFKDGLEHLVKLATESVTAIMCGEEDPSACHRRLLVGRVLHRQGISVKHIRKNGEIQIEDDAPDDDSSQASLFGSGKGDEWKSRKPVAGRGSRTRS
ncbi:DUF488 family protein [Thermodesulfobacteriota bacterium]